VKKVVVAGEINNPNIGDQAIFICLRYLLKKHFSDIEVIGLDISNHHHSNNRIKTGNWPTKWNNIHNLIPPKVFNSSLNVMFHTFKKIRGDFNHWQTILRKADALIIGGGQLFLDHLLDFPLKLGEVTNMASRLGIPFHITSCGVGEYWSFSANSIFTKILKNARSITLRDSMSQARIDKRLPELKTQITFDPAIWTSTTLSVEYQPSTQYLIGICIMEYRYLKRNIQNTIHSRAEWQNYWLRLIQQITSTGMGIELFTTGAPRDYAASQAIFKLCGASGLDLVSIAPRPYSPQDCVRNMLRYNIVIGSRLHSTIIANSLGIISIGLSWDNKIKSYYNDSMQSERCFEIKFDTLDEVTRLCLDSHKSTFPTARIDFLKNRALDNILVLKNHL